MKIRMGDSETGASSKEEKAKRKESGKRGEGGKEDREEPNEGKGKGGKDVDGGRRVPQRTNSQRAEREEERRSRRALFQSVSTSNLNVQQQVINNLCLNNDDHDYPQPSSSLPPPLPRFHLGDLEQAALPPKVTFTCCC